MPKLYYTAHSCGAANFLSAHIAGIHLDTELVDIGNHTTASGVDFYTINPKGNVPTIVLDDGTVLNENGATLTWIADQVPGKVAPAYGTSERYVLQSVLSYLSSEVHPAMGVLFNTSLAPEVSTFCRERLAKKLEYVESALVGDKKYLVGDSLTVVDIYLYIVLTWHAFVNVDLAPYPKIKAYFDAIGADEHVAAAHARLVSNPSSTLE